MQNRRHFLTKVVKAGLGVAAFSSPFTFSSSASADYEAVLNVADRFQTASTDAQTYAAQRGYATFLKASSSLTPWESFGLTHTSLDYHLSTPFVAQLLTDRRFLLEAYVFDTLLRTNPLGRDPRYASQDPSFVTYFIRSAKLASVMHASSYSYTDVLHGIPFVYGITTPEKEVLASRLGARMQFGSMTSLFNSAVALLDSAYHLDIHDRDTIISFYKEGVPEKAVAHRKHLEEKLFDPKQNPYVCRFQEQLAAFDFIGLDEQVQRSRMIRFDGLPSSVHTQAMLSLTDTRVRNLILSLQEEPIHDLTREFDLFYHWKGFADRTVDPLERTVYAHRALPYGRRYTLLEEDPTKRSPVELGVTSLESFLEDQK